MEFKIKRRLISDDEKMRRAIFFYTYDLDFDLEFINGYYEEDDYGQPLIKIKENFDKLDDETKALVLEAVKKDIYDETLDFKCLKCDYQELNIDWEMIEETWDGKDYPKLYCPKCDRHSFVPMDIWKQKNKYKK